jgi:hypothetical protein
MLEYKGDLLGKKIYVYDAGEKCPKETLINEYRRFDKIHLLRQFSDLSVQLFGAKSNTLTLSGIPLNVDFINYCILTAIKYSEGSKTVISTNETVKIMKISYPWYQYELYGNSFDNAQEPLVKTAYRQFVYQDSKAVIGRSIYIFNYLWPIRYNNLFNINDAFLKVFGISYDKILFYGLALSGMKASYFYKKPYIQDFSTNTSIDFQEGDFDKFLNFVSMDTKGFTNYSGSLLNPVFKYPILRTDFCPDGQDDPVYLHLSQACLFNKLIYGIYFDLLEEYMEQNGKNDFKTIFGYVFQDYIGVLLKEHFKKWQVIPEKKYIKDKNEIDTVDWFLKRGKNLVLIEVKQSSIYISAKNSGDIEELKKGIRQNIIKAITQLTRTENDILNKKYRELEQFDNIENIQKLIIIADPLYFGNYIVNALFDNILMKTKIHIMNISDFETLLSLKGNRELLFYFLESKAITDNWQKDFSEYLFEKYGKDLKGNRFLIKSFDKYYRSLKIKMDIE